MGKFDQAVADGLKTSGAVGSAVAATGALIGLAAGASMGPFAAIAAPVGAGIGALIGFFLSLAKHVPSPEEVAAAKAAQAKAAAEAHNIATLVDDPDYASLFANVRAAIVTVLPQAKNIPTGAFLQYISDVRADANSSPQQKAGAQAFTLLKVIAALKAPAPDPLAYFTDPTLKALVGPALLKAGVDVNNPNALKIMQANYAAPPVNTGTIPITRKSKTDAMNAANAAAGGPGGASRYIVDSRAFNMKIAPYGVDPATGAPLRAEWPWGLDADRFAIPPPANAESLANPWSPLKKAAVAIPIAAAIGYGLFFL